MVVLVFVNSIMLDGGKSNAGEELLEPMLVGWRKGGQLVG